MWMTVPSHAQNRGVYPLGLSAVNSSLLPESTFTYSNQALVYTRDQAKDNEGRGLPVTGNHSVILDMSAITCVSNERILGAQYTTSATLPFSQNDLTSDLQGNLSGGSGFADSYYLPVILGWCWKRVAVRVMSGIQTPTGRFRAVANDNFESGYWTHALSSGQTFYLTGNKRLWLSAFQMYEFHTVQEGTGVHPGETFSLDYSLMYSLSDRPPLPVTRRLAGYEQETNHREDRSRHQRSPIRGPVRDQWRRLRSASRLTEADQCGAQVPRGILGWVDVPGILTATGRVDWFLGTGTLAVERRWT